MEVECRDFVKEDLASISIRELEVFNYTDYREKVLKQARNGVTFTLVSNNIPLFILGIIPQKDHTILWGLSDEKVKQYPLGIWKQIKKIERTFFDVCPKPFLCSVDPKRSEAVRFIERLSFKATLLYHGANLIYSRG